MGRHSAPREPIDLSDSPLLDLFRRGWEAEEWWAVLASCTIILLALSGTFAVMSGWPVG